MEMNRDLLRLIYSQKKCGLSNEQILSILLGMGIIEDVAVSHLNHYIEIEKNGDPMKHPDLAPRNGFAILTPSAWKPTFTEIDEKSSDAKDTLRITNGLGSTGDMNSVADAKADSTKKEFGKEDRKGGFKPPKYDVPKKRGDERLISVDKSIGKINSGNGKIMDFETYIKTLTKKTEQDNKD